MKVRTTQIVDYWIGIPLCAALSFFRRLRSLPTEIARLLKSPNHSSGSSPVQRKRILFLELSEMGSAIIAHSALAHTKQLYPDAELYFMVFSKNRESISLLRIIPDQNLILVDPSSFWRFTSSTFTALRFVRSLRIDTVIDLELFSRFTSLVSYLSGAPTRVGFDNYTAEGLYRGDLMTHRVFYNPHQHMEYNFLALIRSLQAPAAQKPLLKEDLRQYSIPLPRHTPSPKEVELLWNLIRSQNHTISRESQLLIVNPDPGEALPIRGWPVERYISAVRQLLAINKELYCVVIGLRSSKPYAERLKREIGNDRIIDLTGRTRSLRDVVTLFALSDLLITNDSGPAHFAALTGISTITLFGPETPALYGPIGKNSHNIFANYSCSPCLSAYNHRHTACRDALCLKAIGTAEVVARAQTILNFGLTQRSDLKPTVAFT